MKNSAKTTFLLSVIEAVKVKGSPSIRRDPCAGLRIDISGGTSEDKG